jgi:hypothetical protein
MFSIYVAERDWKVLVYNIVKWRDEIVRNFNSKKSELVLSL